MSEEVLYFDVPTVAPRPLSQDEIRVLHQMFDSEGWKTFLTLKRIDARSAAAIALDPAASDDVRKEQTCVYHSCFSDITIEERMGDAMEGLIPLPLKDIPQPPELDSKGTLPIDKS